MSIQAAKFHFNLLSPFTCSGHCTGGESHENVLAGTVPNLSSVASTWHFQWLCCSFIYISFLVFADIFFTSQGLSLTPLSLRASKLVSGVLQTIQKTQLNFPIPPPPGHDILHTAPNFYFSLSHPFVRRTHPILSRLTLASGFNERKRHIQIIFGSQVYFTPPLGDLHGTLAY